jgi:hypothetical protein
MRLLAFLLVTGSLALVGCAGDTSSLMSVWNDGSVGGGQPPAGGAGGEGGAGGAGGEGGGGGTVAVPGGVRDRATAQCISTSGGACMFSSDYLACLKGNCASYLSTCYSQPGTFTTAGGSCLQFANCMLLCSCDGNKSTCEDGCMQKYASVNNCWMCIANLNTCGNDHSCLQTSVCPASSGGSSNGGTALGLP